MLDSLLSSQITLIGMGHCFTFVERLGEITTGTTGGKQMIKLRIVYGDNRPAVLLMRQAPSGFFVHCFHVRLAGIGK